MMRIVFMVLAALALSAAVVLLCTDCTRAPAPPPIVIVDADAANLADVGTSPTSCMLACKVLLDTSCHPVSTCVHTCDDLVGAGVFPASEVACVAGATTREGVIACGGGFCR